MEYLCELENYYRKHIKAGEADAILHNFFAVAFALRRAWFSADTMENAPLGEIDNVVHCCVDALQEVFSEYDKEEMFFSCR